MTKILVRVHLMIDTCPVIFIDTCPVIVYERLLYGDIQWSIRVRLYLSILVRWYFTSDYCTAIFNDRYLSGYIYRYLSGDILRAIIVRRYLMIDTCPVIFIDTCPMIFYERYLSDDILWLIRWYLTIIKRMNNNIQTHIQKQHCNSRRKSHFSKYVNGWLTWAVGFWQTLLYMVSMFTRQLAIVDTFSRTKELQCNITVSLKNIMGASTRLQNTW